MDGETNANLNGQINYSDLRKIIFDYFKETQGVELGSISIDYLQSKLASGNGNQPFFIRNDGFGEARFDISKEDIEKIFKSYLASKDCELTSELEYGNYNNITFTYKSNPNIKNEMSKPENKVELDLNYNVSIRYENLRQIIFDHYKRTQGVELKSISIDYLQSKLTGGNSNQPFFIRNDGFGEIRFDISKEEIQEILKSYLASKGFELTELQYTNKVEFKYKDAKKKEQEKKVNGAQVNEFGEIIRSGVSTDQTIPSDFPKFRPPKENKTEENTQSTKSDSQDELARMAREKRKFTILQRERAMSDAQRGKNRSAIMAGLCILGAAVATFFNGQDINQVIQNELNAIYSWEALGQYMQNLGPLTTLLTAGAGGFIAKYFKNSKKLKQAQNEFIDFNNSLENSQTLGGNEDVKSR